MSNDRIRRAVISSLDAQGRPVDGQGGADGAGKPALIWRILSDKRIPLYEIVVLMFILSFLWVLYIGAAFRSGGYTQAELNDRRMILVSMALQSYHWANNGFPDSLGELVCEGPDVHARIPVATRDLLSDVWGVPYIYQNLTNCFVIKSLGEDKKAGGVGSNTDVTLEGP